MSAKSEKKLQQSHQKAKQVNPAIKKESPAGVPKWAVWALLGFTALIYLRALFNDFANLDDDAYIINSPYIRDFSFRGIKVIFSVFTNSNYHPLTILIYLLEYRIAGLSPLLYHLVNVMFHLLNVWLVYKLAEKLSGKSITAIVTAVLFALHPMHVESVAWVSELKDVLYSGFFLLSLLAYLRFIERGKQAKYYFAALLFFVLSLLSKSAAVTLPVLFIAADIYKGKKINLKLLPDKIPFLLLSLLFGILAVISQRVGASTNDISVSFTFIERVFLFTYTVSFYIVKMIAPFALSVMHYYPNEQSLPFLYYASLPFLIILAWLVIRRSSFRKEIMFGTFFFLITISIMLQVVHVGFALTAERYTYIPYTGLFYFTGQWISSLWNNKKKRKTIIAVFLLFVIMFSFQTISRIGIWKNGETLFTDVIEKNPEIYHGHWTRGNIRFNKKDYNGALLDYNKTIECNPVFALCFVIRGDVKNKLNDYPGALQDLNRAVSLDPTIAEAYNNRGLAYEGLGNTTAAMQDYNKAILINPKYAKACNNRGVLKAKTGDYDGAMKDINAAISLTPHEATLYSYRGNIKNFRKDYWEAINDFNLALKIEPGFAAAYYNRGMSRFFLSDTAGACKDWNKAAELGDKMASQIIQQYCR